MSTNPDGVDVSNMIVLLVDDTEAAHHAGAWALGAAGPSVVLRYLACTGDLVTEVERIANEIKADAVVLPASVSGDSRLGGSVASRLVRAAHWPVTVIP